MQFVQEITGQYRIILASDNVYTYFNLNHLISVRKDETFDTTAYVKSMVGMKTLVSNLKCIISGHDALLFSKFPKVPEGVIKIK